MLPSGRGTRLRNIWITPAKLPAVQSFLLHVAQFPLQYHLIWSCLKSQSTFFVRYDQRSNSLGSILLLKTITFLRTAWTTRWLLNPVPLNTSRLGWDALLQKVLGRLNQRITTMAKFMTEKLRYSRVDTLLGTEPFLLRSMASETGPLVLVRKHNGLMARPPTFSWYQIN